MTRGCRKGAVSGWQPVRRYSCMRMQTVDYSPSEPTPEAVLRLAHSRFYQRLHRRYASELALFPAGVPVRAGMEEALDALSRQGMDLGAALRVLRQLVMERLVQLDCAQQAPLAVVTQTVTQLAEVVLDRACIQVRRELDERHGAPLGPQRCGFPGGSEGWQPVYRYSCVAHADR